MQTVVGVFDSAADAQMAREQLVNAGFGPSSVSVQSHPDEADTGISDSRTARGHDDGGFMSSVSNFFSDLFGGDNDDTGHYSEAVRRGGSVVTVSVEDNDRVDEARAALAAAGAVNIDKRADEWRQQGYAGFDPAAQPFKSDEVQAERGRVIPVVREELEVGKREVDLGVVRVYARTESRPVNETIELREQHAEIDRRPVDRPATEADLNAFKDATIEVRETAERAVVNKSARVVEEVTVGTQSASKTETISDNVRNTVVEVDRDTAGNAMQERSAGYRTHFQNNFASAGDRYEDYEPAYQYGSTLRSDSRYSNRSWEDIEPQAQQDWSSKNQGGAWERTKAAVRHGWESATSGGSGRSSGTMGTGSSATGSTVRGGPMAP